VLDFLLARRRMVLGGFVFAAVGMLAVHPTWASSIGADVWNMPSLKEELRANTEEASVLANQDDEIRHRISLKEVIIADLLANRITLAEATEQFTVMNASRPQYMTMIRSSFPGETDQEKFARNVISFALLRVKPQERDALNHRLEKELHLMLTGSAVRGHS